MRKQNAVERARLLNTRGIKLIDARRFEEAEKSFRRAIDAAPAFAPAWDNLAVVLMHQRRFSEALFVLLRALELDPSDPNCRFNLGLLVAEHPDEIALDQFHETLRLDPEYPDADYYLGMLYFDRNQEDTAQAHFRRAIEINPDDVRVLLWEARDAYDAGEYERSIGLCQRVLDLEPSPSDPEVYMGLGHAYAALGRYEQAGEYFERYVTGSPYDPYGHYLLACIFATTDQADLALRSLEDASTLSRKEVMDWAPDDPRLDSIRHNPRFRKLMGEEVDD